LRFTESNALRNDSSIAMDDDQGCHVRRLRMGTGCRAQASMEQAKEQGNGANLPAETGKS
jgi:hypothetical protein